MYSGTCQSWPLHNTESCTNRTKNKDPILETEHMNRKKWSQRGSVWTGFTVCVDSLIDCTSCELYASHNSLIDCTFCELYASHNSLIDCTSCELYASHNSLIDCTSCELYASHIMICHCNSYDNNVFIIPL